MRHTHAGQLLLARACDILALAQQTMHLVGRRGARARHTPVTLPRGSPGRTKAVGARRHGQGVAAQLGHRHG
ncbi:hypothetical protein FGX01_02855, partial [Xylella fastidiosa subsp. multiplex]|nr:hypothetical protein [Xylella fastidiosa subsp. multiplex]